MLAKVHKVCRAGPQERGKRHKSFYWEPRQAKSCNTKTAICQRGTGDGIKRIKRVKRGHNKMWNFCRQGPKRNWQQKAPLKSRSFARSLVRSFGPGQLLMANYVELTFFQCLGCCYAYEAKTGDKTKRCLAHFTLGGPEEMHINFT